MFTATHRYRGTFRDPSVLVEYAGPGIRESEAMVRFDPACAGRGDGLWRVGRKSLIPLDECSCEFEDDGDGETGPRLAQHVDPSCPHHGQPRGCGRTDGYGGHLTDGGW